MSSAKTGDNQSVMLLEQMYRRELEKNSKLEPGSLERVLSDLSIKNIEFSLDVLTLKWLSRKEERAC